MLYAGIRKVVLQMKLDRVIAVRNNKTVYRDGDKVIKLFSESYSKAEIFNEAVNQARVEEIGLNTPKVLEVTKYEGKWAIVSEFIAGKTLAELMRENPEKTDEYISMFVDLQMSIHEKHDPMLNDLKETLWKKISITDLDATQRYDLHNRLQAMPKHNKVCHGDFNTSNVIITSDGTPYILDWAHVAQGNASADVAKSFLLFRINGENELSEKYLTEFCEKSDVEMRYVKTWLPLVAAARLAKGNENERDILIKLVNYLG